MPQKKPKKERITHQDILEAINQSSNHIEERFRELTIRVDNIQNSMVTKDHFERRVGKLEIKVEKIEVKMGRLVNVLHKKQVLTDQEFTNVRVA